MTTTAEGMSKRAALRDFLSFWKVYVIILTPLILLPLPLIINTMPAKGAYGALVIAIFWISEALPLAVTSLLPLVLFPMLGVMSSKKLSPAYFKDTNAMLFGGLVVAVAVEHTGIHKRFALRVLMMFGSNPRWIMLGFMCPTFFLSMWISNTATTAMMLPIMLAILSELCKTRSTTTTPRDVIDNRTISADVSNKSTGKSDVIEMHKTNQGKEESMLDKNASSSITGSVSMETSGMLQTSNHDDAAEPELSSAYKKTRKGMLLSICYAANIGGTATLTGTGPNLVFAGIIKSLYGNDASISFANWFAFSAPCAIVCLFLSWIWLQIVFLDNKTICRRNHVKSAEEEISAANIKTIIQQEYESLGPIRFEEKMVLLDFVILVLLWIFRDPKFTDGWGILFREDYVNDATAAILLAVMLFVLPRYHPRWFLCGKSRDHRPVQSVLTWEVLQQKLPWSIILLMGGGFAIAEAVDESGLSSWLGLQLAGIGHLQKTTIAFILCILVATLTEVASNTATATIFLPILASTAVELNINPIYLMLPCTVAASFAFMLPAATPPNAIVFGSGDLQVIDMVKAGFLMNIICISVLTLALNTWGVAMFQLNTFPEWANKNITTATTPP